MNAKLLRMTDRYFGLLLYILCWLLRPVFIGNAKNKNMLIIKLWAIGESTLILPSIKSLKSHGYKITVLCTKQNMAVFEDQEFVDNIILFEPSPIQALKTILSLKKYNFSVSVDMDPYMKFSSVLGLLSGASKRVGLENRKYLYTISVPINEDEHAVLTFNRIANACEKIQSPKELLPIKMKKTNFIINEKSIAIHAGSAETSTMRRWPENKFAEVCDYFLLKGWTIYLVGSKEEKEINMKIIELVKNKKNILDISGKTDIHQLAYIFSKASLVIANDSGPMHIAAASGTPTIGIFGPNTPKRFGPYGINCIGLRKDGPICIRPFLARFPQCKHDHMKYLMAEDVIKVAEKIIG